MIIFMLFAFLSLFSGVFYCARVSSLSYFSSLVSVEDPTPGVGTPEGEDT
jgi:hypothetical protein